MAQPERAGGTAEELGRRADSHRRLIESMAHALRTPLGTISSSAVLLREAGGDPATLAKVAEILDRVATAATAMVADMEELARLVDGIELDLGPIDGEAMARSVIAEARPAALARKITLRLAPVGEPSRLTGDESRLRQALGRLVGHCIEHAAPETVMSVFVEATDDIACFTVEDHGPGIPCDQLPWLFESDGFRAPSRRRGGLGLGLAIVREIARAHRGSVRCDPAEHCTATFRLAVPNDPGA